MGLKTQNSIYFCVLTIFLFDSLALFWYIEIMNALQRKLIKFKTSLFGFNFVRCSAYANPAGLFFLSRKTQVKGHERKKR